LQQTLSVNDLPTKYEITFYLTQYFVPSFIARLLSEENRLVV